MLVVDAQTSADIYILHLDMLLLQFVLYLVYPVTQSFEVAHVKNLRADVEVQTYEFYVLHLCGFLDGRKHVAHCYTELVLSQSCGNLGIRVCTYVWIYAEAHPCYLTFLLCQLIDNLKLGDTFHIEAENVLVESKVYLPVGLSNSCIYNLLR